MALALVSKRRLIYDQLVNMYGYLMLCCELLRFGYRDILVFKVAVFLVSSVSY